MFLSQSITVSLWFVIPTAAISSGEIPLLATHSLSAAYWLVWNAAEQRRIDEDIERIGGLYKVRVTVRWGDRFRGHGEKESYITFWRKSE